MQCTKGLLNTKKSLQNVEPPLTQSKLCRPPLPAQAAVAEALETKASAEDAKAAAEKHASAAADDSRDWADLSAASSRNPRGLDLFEGARNSASGTIGGEATVSSSCYSSERVPT